MIVKFFKSNKQPIQNAFAYFLNERVESNTARLLSGSLGLAEMLAENQRSSVKYFSGCLSFKEAPEHFSEQDKYEIMDEFMQAIMPHKAIRERIHWTWIEHTDKCRLELNFVVNTRFLEPIGNIKQCQLVMTRIDAIITAWKRELNKNLLTSTYMPEEEQSNLNQKIIKFRKEVWRYSTIDAMNENMVRFLNDEAKEHGYVEELDSINCTIFHQLFDKINEDSDQIDKVVTIYRVLERLFGFEKVVSLCCKRDTNNQTAIEILLIKLQNIYKRSNSKYRERK